VCRPSWTSSRVGCARAATHACGQGALGAQAQVHAGSAGRSMLPWVVSKPLAVASSKACRHTRGAVNACHAPRSRGVGCASRRAFLCQRCRRRGCSRVAPVPHLRVALVSRTPVPAGGTLLAAAQGGHHPVASRGRRYAHDKLTV
jgi:hypothetical protein